MQGFIRSVLILMIIGCCTSLSSAQGPQQAVPLELASDPDAIQIPPYATLAERRCDGSGSIYLRTLGRQGMSFSFSSQVVRIASDASAETIPLGRLPGSGADSHVFQFAVAQDGSLYEIVRAQTSSGKGSATQIYYLSFEPDGTLRSMAAFDQEFVPSVLLPLPTGDFFAEGVTLTRTDAGVRERALVAIFGADARLKRRLQQDKTQTPGSPASEGKPKDYENPFVPGNTAVLGSDGNIYFVLAADPMKVAVVSPAGDVIRTLTLPQPLKLDVIDGIWASGSRMLVSYEGEADSPKARHMYVLYDTETGAVERMYLPDFAGVPACFDGDQISVLLLQNNSGIVELASANLQ